MGTTTTNLGLYKPSIGETGWGALVDSGFDTLDTAISPFTTTIYVRPTGSNSNNGLSWAKAKKDILGAYDVLPRGDTLDGSGGGWIIFESGSYVDATNTDRGFWLLGANDSNHVPLGVGTLPTGWRQQHGTLRIEGVPSVHVGGNELATALLYGGSTTDATKPLFWFAGLNTSVELVNVAAWGALAQPMELGKDSGTGEPTNNANITCDNIFLSADTGNAAHGPTINATSAYWFFVRRSTLVACGDATYTADNRATILMPATPGGSSQPAYHDIVHVRDCNFNRGGGLVQRATSADTTITMENVTQEPGVGGTSQAIMWLHARMDPGNTAGAIKVSGCTQADQAVGSHTTVVVDAGNDPCNVVVVGTVTTTGPCTKIGGAGGRSALSAGSERAVGFVNRRVVGQHDGHRRSFSPTAVRATNLATQDVSLWGGLGGGATVTTGKAAPDGSTNAAELSGASASRRVVASSRTVAVGDWVIAGVWLRPVSGVWPTDNSVAEVLWSDSNNLFDSSAAGVNFFDLFGPYLASTKEWSFEWRAQKVTQATTTPSLLNFDLRCNTGATMAYFAPILLHIATGTYTDAEVLEIAQNIAPWPETASAGQLAVMRDQSLHIPRGYIEIGEMTAPSAGATNYGRIYMEDNGAGKTRMVAKFPTGAAVVIATEP